MLSVIWACGLFCINKYKYSTVLNSTILLNNLFVKQLYVINFQNYHKLYMYIKKIKIINKDTDLVIFLYKVNLYFVIKRNYMTLGDLL